MTDNNLYWMVDESRKIEGIVELKSEGSHYTFYIKKNNKEEIKKAIQSNFMLSTESKLKAIEVIDSL